MKFRGDSGSDHRRIIFRTVMLPLLILSVLTIGCSYLPRNAGHEVYAPAKYGSDRFANVMGYNIHYVEAGEGPSVLLIPGAFCTYRVWNPVIRYLSKDYRVFAVDYLGVGDSDKPDRFGYSVEEQADVIAALIRGLNLRKVFLVGASYGSVISLDLASRYPELVEAVVGIEGGVLTVPKILRYKGISDILRWPVAGDIMLALMKTNPFPETVAKYIIGGAWDGLTKAQREEMSEVFSANIGTASRVSWSAIDRTISGTINITDKVRKTEVPVVYLYGGASRYRDMSEVNARFFLESMPSARVVRFEDGVHDLHLQYPEQVAGVITGYWKEKLAANMREELPRP